MHAGSTPLIAAVSWADGVSALGGVLTPLVLAGLGYVVSKRLSALEDQRQIDHELISLRVSYYREMTGPLNDLFCYFTFVGCWKERTPPQMVEAKRALDRCFYTAAPLFRHEVSEAYNAFMDHCFKTYGLWGADAKLRTGFGKRQEYSRVGWEEVWEEMFELPAGTPLPPERIDALRLSYDNLVSRLVDDLKVTPSRTNYTSPRVVVNAH